MNTLSTERPIPKPVETPLKYVIYARKSTESDEKQALSIDSQINEMLSIAKRDELEVVDIQRESYSSKEAGQRPVFNAMLDAVRIGKYNAILTWAPDRLSRNAGDLGAIVDLLDKNVLMEVRTYGQTFRNNPNEKFLLMILGSQAKLENDQKGVNVKRGLKTRCTQGLWPAPPPTGYLKYNQKDRLCECYIDPERGHYIQMIFEKVANEGWSGRYLQRWLREEMDFKTVRGKYLNLSTIYKILNTPFYYGEFEYPKGSGFWYKGKHEPLITKELYESAQRHIQTNRKEHSVRKNAFAFTRIMKCGACGSGICAQEKFKKCKNGNTWRYVYYCCTKARDRYCKQPYLREDSLIEQIADIIDTLDLDQVDLGYRIQKEIERYSNFQAKVLKMTPLEIREKRDLDVKNYAKYLLTDGTLIEKRELLENLKSRLTIHNKILSLE